MSENRERDLEKNGEFESAPTCLTCNTKISVEHLTCCSSCKKHTHLDCCKMLQGLMICNQCTGNKIADITNPKPVKSIRSSTSSSAKRRELKLKCLEEEKALELKKLSIEKEFLAKKYSLLEQDIGSEEDEVHSNRSGYVRNWVEEVQDRSRIAAQSTALNPLAPVFEHHEVVQPHQEEQLTPNVIPGGGVVQSKYDHSENSNDLTKSQINARKIVFDLPKFNGKPKEWPHFISSFEESTRLCGFQNFENIARLRNSLKGIAFESVWPQLSMTSDVSGIIMTLKTLFGRPELIIKELLAEINSTKPIKEENLLSIMNLAMAVQNLVATINSSGMLEHMNNPSLLESLVEKLPPTLKLQWGMRRLQSASINLTDFNKWIQEVSMSARMVTNEIPKLMQTELKSEKKGSTGGGRLFLNVHSNLEQKPSSECIICGMSCERITDCKAFLSLSLKKKWEAVNSNQLCRTCLDRRHKRSCPSEKLCGIDGCIFKHNPLLHKITTESSTESYVENTQCFPHGEHQSSVFYKIIPIKLYGSNTSIDTYAFLDDGSGLTLIDEELARQLNLSGFKQPLCLTWTGNQSRLEENSQVVAVNISSFDGEEVYRMTDVRTVQELALPRQSLSSAYINSHQHLKGLPIIPYSSAQPRLLIGLKYMRLALPLKTFEGRQDDPICFLTRLGYVVFGNGDHGSNKVENSINVHKCECELHQLVNSYFSLENVGVVPTERSLTTADEKRAINILEKTTKRIGLRYETGLIWRYDDVKFPNNLLMARKRMQCLQKKLASDINLKDNMMEQICDHAAKGYIRQLSEDEANSRNDRTWYLPIFPVTNPNKPDKVRIVWDAAAKFNGVSLNSMLIKGPDQMSSLVGVLFRFRQHRFAITGDIMQMFHQVRVRKEDQDSQRFLWMDPTGKEVTYVMEVMTFGSSCSPSCAQYVKNINAERYTTSKPRAVIGITKNHYVDDFLDGMHTEEELLSLAQDVREIHQNGGFHIRNWTSNSQQVLSALNAIPGKDVEKNLNICPEVDAEKVLGLLWSTQDDVFKYRLKVTEHNREILMGQATPTKRQLLSTMMQIFDPLGFLSNVMIIVKLILQEVWQSGVDWDEPIKSEQFSKWKDWLVIISKIDELEIPRWHFTSASPDNLELHVFVDGSLLAYSAVAFFRYDQGDQHLCSLIGAKGKVASMKLTSVPRIELMGALIGARFAKSIEEEHFSLNITRRVFWCDSVTVLKWINNEHLKFKQFVGFRIGEILELSSAKEWRYVPSKLNVADQATKSTKNPSTCFKSEWFQGPQFLHESEINWPSNILITSEESQLELREVFTHSDHQVPHLVSFEKYSSFNRLLRAVAWVVKAASIWKVYRKSQPSRSQSLTMSELKSAECLLIRQSQYEVFHDEMVILSKVKEGSTELRLEKSSPWYRETPYLDEFGVARRRGRIDAASVAFGVKRPILLSRHHALTFLIIRHHHEMYQHANDETVINELLQKYAIPAVRVILKTVKRRCQKCKNAKAVPAPPLMAELPSSRLQSFVRPFSYVGVDYFGPIMVTVRRHPEKRWVMLLTCLSIRAIHMEIASSLTSDSCIMCVNRFIARRGTPIEIISDNGTNLKGAANELKAFLEDEANQKALQTKFTTPSMKWKFITPGAPHMGGCWERLIRSVKTTLSEIMPLADHHNPNEETLHTMLLEVEAAVNSRPLTYVGVEDPSQEALTPNHFLLGSSSGSKPIGHLPEFYQPYTILRKNWMTAQQLANQFWIRWIREHLPKLSRRPKWYETERKVEVGDIVILFDEQTARSSWPKGIVVEAIKSKADNEVRSAVVQTQSGRYTRPVTKMAVLDVTGKCPDDQDHLRGELLATERLREETSCSSTHHSPSYKSSLLK